MSNESITPLSAPDNFLSPSLNYLSAKIRVKFSGSCLTQDKITYTHGRIVNIYIVYEMNKNDNTITSDPLQNSLFGAVTLTENVNIDRYAFSGYGIGFDRKRSFSFSGGRYGQNALIFGVDMSFSVNIDNIKKDILVLGWSPTQGLENTLTAEKMYSINFTEKNKTLCVSLHYNGALHGINWGINCINGTEIYIFKAKNSEIVASSLCLGNISKDWLIDNMKRTGLNGYVYDLSVFYIATDVDDIKNIHKYLMNKNNIV